MRRAIAAAALACFAFPAGASAAACAPPADGGDWPGYGATLDNHREQLAETVIGADNAAELGVAWQAPTPDGGVIHSVPTVAGGCVFFGTDLGSVFALNADSGEVVWTRSLLGDGAPGSGTFQGAGIVGAPAIADGLVHVGATTPGASVSIALHQATGEVAWTTVLDTDSGGGVDSSPVPFDGMLFQAYQGDESSNHSNPGYVILDAASGTILESRKVLPAEDFAAGDRGGSIVSTPAVDLERKLLFAGTGNPASRRQNPRTDSQIAIDVDPASATFGDIVDSVRGTSDSYPLPMDVDSPVCSPEVQWPVGRFTCGSFDFNFLSSGVLFDHADGRKLYGQLQKSGVFQTVDTATMDVVWKATLGAPCLGCNLSSAASDGDAVYVALTGGNLYALDRDTGAIRWAVPGTGGMRFNGLSVANGVLYSTNDLGALQAFDTAAGTPLLVDPYAPHTSTPMQDLGNSSGISIARNTVFVSSKDPNSTSTLFAYKIGVSGGGGGPELPPLPEPPGGGGAPAPGVILSGPGAASYGYLTPAMITTVGGAINYTNGDIARHDVVATEKGADGKPLFRSELATLGETVPVNGLDRVQSGKTYQFFCSLHPGMKGQLIVQ